MMTMLFSVLAAVALFVAPAQAGDCTGVPADWIEAVRTKGKRDAYLCLATTEAAGAVLLQTIGQEGFASVDGKERVTRALAVHLLHQLERPLTGAEVRALAPSDRRLLRDGVYARRGRPTPSPEHEAVFSQFAWYVPVAEFNNGRLQPPDRANLSLIDKPPPPPKEEARPSAAEAMAETNIPRPPPPPGAPPPPEGAPPPDDLPPGPATGPVGRGPETPAAPAPGGSAAGAGCAPVSPAGPPPVALVAVAVLLGLVRRQA